MKGLDGKPLITPSELPDDAAAQDWYQHGRRYGLYQANNAITWQTTCTGCAEKLDQHAAGFFDGERSGIAAALRAVREATSDQTTVQEIIDVLAGKVERLLDAHRPLTPGDHHDLVSFWTDPARRGSGPLVQP